MLDPEAAGRDRRDLAVALRTLRRASGLSGERLAARTHMSQGKISRIETGRVVPSLVDVERILQALDVSPDEAKELTALAKIANTEVRSNRQINQLGVAHRQRELAAMEERCARQRHMLPAMLTGLLQTADYVAANAASMPAGVPEGQREELVLRKVERQERLLRKDKKFSFLLMEAAVRCRVVSPPAMAVQVDHLVSLDMMPNVDIEVIPLDRIIPSPPLNVFVVYDEWLVTLETEAGMIILRDPRDVRHHLELFEFYRELALKGEECREFLRGIAEEFRSISVMSDAAMLAVAVEEARAGLAEGGIPIGAALFGPDGEPWGRGRNRRVQDGDPSMHGETSAFRNAGRRRSYRGSTMVTTLSPCWYCSGLVRQFGISRVLIGEATTFSGGHEWLAEHGVEITILDDAECVDMMTTFIAERPELWFEDIGD